MILQIRRQASFTDFLNMLIEKWVVGGETKSKPEKFLIPQHPVQHAFKERNRNLSTIQSSTHKEHLHKFFPKLQNVVFFGSIVYKEHLCLNTKD